MGPEDLRELHYICPIENVKSILTRGILSHNAAECLPHTSIAMHEIQERREGVVIPGGKRLHEYVNLYFCARNPMLYKRQDQRDLICILRISAGVLELKGVVIADGNASSHYTRFSAAPGGLRSVRWDLTFAEDWRDEDLIAYYQKSCAKCAEVLVPGIVESQYIQGAYVANEAGLAELKNLCPSLPVQIDKHMYFL